MPKLWSATIETHRREVQEAVLDATAALVAAEGLRSVTMSQIAERAGIARATLYKYFTDIETIFAAWHERQIHAHLAQLTALANHAGDPVTRLEAVLEAYALIQYEHHGSELEALVHRREHVRRAHQHLTRFVHELVAEGAERGKLRSDVSPAELASYCLHALAAASRLTSKAAVQRLVAVVVAGLQPPR